jgi:hypothetical protein
VLVNCCCAPAEPHALHSMAFNVRQHGEHSAVGAASAVAPWHCIRKVSAAVTRTVTGRKAAGLLRAQGIRLGKAAACLRLHTTSAGCAACEVPCRVPWGP